MRRISRPRRRAAPRSLGGTGAFAFTLALAFAAAPACSSTATIAFCALPIDGAPVRGPADAPVTLVEFSDFECSYCGRAAPTVEQLLAAQPDDVRHVFRHLPLPQHAAARPAAVAAVCAAEQGLFWELHDLLFEHQDALSEADLVTHAAAVGLDLAAWDACRSSAVPRLRLDDDEAAAVRAGVGATPTFFVNGEPLVGALPLADFVAAVERALDDAAASGLPAGEYYDSLVALGCE